MEEQTNREISEYLRCLSQRVYNLIQIIRTHCKEPIEIDKELMEYYDIEKAELGRLLSKQPAGLKFVLITRILSDGLISNYVDTRESKFLIDNAKNRLGDLLAKIQAKRKGPKTTGVESGNLKNLLDSMNKRKERLVEEKILRTTKTPKIKINYKDILDKKESEVNKFPHKLPRGTNWGSFIIKFLDKERVQIKVKKFEHIADYKEMGFIGRGKDPKPSEAWIFLKVLADLGGELTVKDSEAKEKYKKQKEILSQSLEDYFTLEYDPFYPYKQSIKGIKNRNSYKIKIRK